MNIKQNVIFSLVLFSCALLFGCAPAPEQIHKKAHAEAGTYVADIANDGSFSVVATDSNGVLLWPRYANDAKYQWRQDDADVSQIIAVDIGADGRTVATASRKAFSLWDANSGENLGYWQSGGANIANIAVSNNGSTIVLGLNNGTQIAFNPETGRRLEFYGHQNAITDLVIAPNGRYALSGSTDQTAILWSTESGQPIHQWQHETRLTKVALDASGRYALTAGSLDKAYIWNVNTGKQVTQLDIIERVRIFSSARFSESGEFLITGSPSRQITLWRTQTGEELRAWNVELRDSHRPNNAVVLSVWLDENTGAVMSESSAGYGEWWQLESNWQQ
ncbi:WD40 repeat domain-containing protein [Idiomarina sp.]|jgi:WD40 repeat protein|uniref:WD40 repeat domain-containing protein n=1 Tax=Idiomarina sp. TaxID=1874361 RepID=UPI0035143116